MTAPHAYRGLPGCSMRKSLADYNDAGKAPSWNGRARWWATFDAWWEAWKVSVRWRFATHRLAGRWEREV